MEAAKEKLHATGLVAKSFDDPGVHAKSSTALRVDGCAVVSEYQANLQVGLELVEMQTLRLVNVPPPAGLKALI